MDFISEREEVHNLPSLLAVRGDLLLAAGLAVRLEEIPDCFAVLRLHRSLLVFLHRPSIFSEVNRAERADLLAAGERIGNLPRGALSDIPARVHDEDLVRHINLAQVHLVQHLLRPLRPDLLIAAVSEEPDRDDDVAIQCQALLRLNIFVPEASAAAEGYDFESALHTISSLRYTALGSRGR